MKQFTRTTFARAAFGIGTVVLLTGAAGPVSCSQQAADTVAVVETKVQAFIAKVKTNAPIVLADAKAAVGLACSLIPVAQQIVATIQSEVSGLSDKAQSALNASNVYANKGNSACGAYAQTQDKNLTPSDAVNTTIAAWNAYQAAKAQINVAQARVTAASATP